MSVENKNKVLIVDDQPRNLQVLALALNNEGIKSVAATSGIQAIKIVENNPPDLILLDIMMPDLDGYETCRIIKQIDEAKDIPIIFLTAKNETEDIIHGFELGAVDYVTKPFNQAELIKRVFTHLELKNSRDLISEQNKELTKINATKDKMFSIIAHDLRGPLGGFRNMLDMILSQREMFSQEEIDHWLSLLQKTANDTYSLLENLLNWSRAQKDALIYKPEKYKIEQIARNTISLLENTAQSKKIKISNNIDPQTEAQTDRDMFGTIMRNLISNAIKFTPENGLIEISAEKTENFIKISVKDNGRGIDNETKNKLFSETEHITTYGTNNEKGSGLGLLLCKELVEKHGGKIGVESEPEKGSCFWFTLPE